MKPQPGPQTLFAACPADVAFFASSPGSGKSYALCMELLRWTHLKNYTGVGLRAEQKDLARGPTSLFGTLKNVGERMQGTAKQTPPGLEFGGSSVLLLHGNKANQKTFDGLEIALSCWDEVDHFDLSLFRYVTGSRARTTCGIRPYTRASVMPSPDSWVHELVKPWLDEEGYVKESESGKVRWYFYDDRSLPQIYDTEQDAIECAKAVDPRLKPKSLSFIFAKTTDNLALMRVDPHYLDRLSDLPPHERKRLLYACWNARPDSAGLFDRTWFVSKEHAPSPKDIIMSVRGWDFAATKPSAENDNPDWSRGVRLDVLRDRSVCISDMVSRRDTPGPVNELVAHTAQADGPNVVQAFSRDPAAAGVRDEESIRAAMAKVPGCGPVKFELAGNKLVQAKAWSAYASDRMANRSPGFSFSRATWNGELFSELESFPNKKAKDDIVDAISYAWREIQPRLLTTGIGSGLHAMLKAASML